MKTIYLFILLISFSKCAMDYSCSNEIINESNSTIRIDIFYDEFKLDSLKEKYGSNKESAASFLTKQGNISGQLFQIDTIRFAISYNLNRNDTVTINRTIGGRLVEPDYSLIQKIIFKSDSNSQTIVNSNLPKIFKRADNDLSWIFKIQ